MAAPASKRRKVEHVSSDEEDDGASFASFGDSADEDGEEIEKNGVIEDDLYEDSAEEFTDGSSEDDIDDDDLDESEGPDDEAMVPPTVRNGAAQDKQSSISQKKATARRTSDGLGLGSSTYTAGAFKSSMFKLQVDELLEQIRPRHGKKETEAEGALHKLKKAIEDIPPQAPVSVEDAERQLLSSSQVAIPFPDPPPPKNAKYKLEYAKPVSLNVVGSHALRTASRSKKTIEIDMVVMMPASIFQEKDYLNDRYFYKRAHYLACIAAGLKRLPGSEFHIRFQNLHDNPLKPVLIVTPVNSSGERQKASSKPSWQINILPCVHDNVFSPEKLHLDKACVRHQTNAATSEALSYENQSPTPFYNSSLRSDMLMTSYPKLLHGAAKTCEAFRDACLLGSTWLRQRGFGSGVHAGGFGNFESSALMAILLQSGGPNGRPMLNEGYSSYQLFKATLQLLAVKDLGKQPLILGAGEAVSSSKADGPVVWDNARKHNLLFKMTTWSYRYLRQEARTTLSMLNDQQFDGFDATFIQRTDGLMYRYDYIVEIDAPSVEDAATKDDHNALERYRKLYDTLHRGLGDRLNQINLAPKWSESWGIRSTSRSQSTERKLLVGFVVNPNTVSRTVDHGPSAEEKSLAASFRKFWGEKAELRRFKDGSILECLVWSGKESGQSVFEQIVSYLISRHFGTEAEQRVNFFGDIFRRMLPNGNGIAAFQSSMEAFKQLESDIRGLDGMPLTIRQIMPADAQLRYASIAVPSTQERSMPADTTILFEGSARWPEDLIAIQRTKAAFLLKLAELLHDSVEAITAKIGLEDGEHDILNQAFLDIIYDSGAAFRLRIHHDREQALLERQLKDKALDPRSKEIAALALAKYKRDYVKSPAHTQAIAGLCSRQPAMSGTIRLVKRWFACHLLANHVADEVLELIVARTFVRPWPWSTPSSVQIAFIRTLSWISRWDWKADPVIVDLSGSGELKQSDIQSITTKFEAWRKLDPAQNRVVLFAASNVDQDGTTWTDGRPVKVVAGRMTALAKAACAEVEEKQLRLEPASLFTSPTSDFDFIIRMNPGLTGKKPSRKHSSQNGVTFKNLELDLVGDASTVGLDSLHDFTEEIQSLYGSAILFFSGGNERPIIGGLWSPQTAPRSWRLNLAYSTTPLKRSDKDDIQGEINKEAILAEIAHLGGDLIQNIEVNRP